MLIFVDPILQVYSASVTSSKRLCKKPRLNFTFFFFYQR